MMSNARPTVEMPEWPWYGVFAYAIVKPIHSWPMMAAIVEYRIASTGRISV